MTDQKNFSTGSIGWADLTVNNAEEIRKFYEEVIGFKSSPVSMGDYNDYTMLSPKENIPYAGVCNNKGANKGLPPFWLIYFNVADIIASVEKVKLLGGEVLFEPKQMGDYGKYCVIKDPAGAFCALFEPEM